MPGNHEAFKATAERMVYGAIIFATAKLVDKGYMTFDMQAYVAAGAVTFIGGAYAWWKNRPAALIDRAASQLPPSATLVIATPVTASAKDKEQAHEIAASAGEKVEAKVVPS